MLYSASAFACTFGAGVGTVDPPPAGTNPPAGMTITCPVISVSVICILFAASKSSTVTPYTSEMLVRLSPGCTTCSSGASLVGAAEVGPITAVAVIAAVGSVVDVGIVSALSVGHVAT